MYPMVSVPHVKCTPWWVGGSRPHLLRLAAEGECEVGVDGAFVELIEDHCGHTFETGLGLRLGLGLG